MTILLKTYGKPELTTIDCDDAPGRYGSGQAGDLEPKVGRLACMLFSAATDGADHDRS
jgi:hypothetical protein